MKERNEDMYSGPLEGERIVEVDLERLKPFRDHPFKVCQDKSMLELMDSIRQYGILNPLIVRPRLDGNYEIISGHRRKHAAERLGFYKVPVIIRLLHDEDSVICMVDSNLQRDRILPSEKAFAYKMKNQALKRKTGKKSTYDSSQIDQKVRYKRTVDELGALGGDSARQVGRYIRLTFLIPELLKKVDSGEMGFNPAVTISFLTEGEQRELLKAMKFTQSSPSLSQAQRIRTLSREDSFTREKVIAILGEVKKGEINRVIFKNEQLYRFFPKNLSPEEMKQKIIELLIKHMENTKEE